MSKTVKSASTRNLSTSLSDGKLDIFEPSKAQSKLDALRKSQEIDKSLKRARSEIDEVRKSSSMVLLLGPGDSGKTTFLRQLKLKCGVEFGADELTSSKSAIHSSINNTIFSLITEVKKQKLKLKKENVNKAQEIIDFNDIFNGAVKNIPFNLCAAFKSVWKDPVVQEVLLNSIFVDDNSISFLNDIERIIAEEYVPSNEDVLLSRSPTLVITETKLLVKTAKSARQVNFVDVGGQKSLRKAWIPYFDNMVTSIIFIASIAGYDEYLDDKKNIIVDATELFNEIINNQWFINLPAIILLNKIDLFEKKLHRAKIRDHFPDFKNHNNLQSGKEFFKLQFEKLVKNTSKRETFIRIYKVNLDFTKNTDRKLTKFVIEAVFNIIIDGNLSVL